MTSGNSATIKVSGIDKNIFNISKIAPDSKIKSSLDIEKAEAVVLYYVRKSGAISKVDLVDKTGFSRTKINGCLNSLLDKQVLKDSGVGDYTGGRRSVLYGLNGEKGIILGADIGATSINLLVTDFSGKKYARFSEKAIVGDGPEKILGRVCSLFSQLITEKNLEGKEIIGVGIGVPGPVDFKSGLVISPPIMPGWDKFPIIDFVQKRFPDTLVVVDNDVNIMAIGEHTAGQGVGKRNMIFVKIGTGIGAGIICRGQIYRGTDGCAGDIGHICVDKNGPICNCGNVGCLEALAGGGAISNQATEAAREGKSKTLQNMLKNGKENLFAEDVSRAASIGDSFSLELINRNGQLIGEVLAGLVNFFNPELIVIGGKVSNFGNSLLSSIRGAILLRSLPLATKNLSIVFSSIPSDAGVVGAINLVVDLSIFTNK